MYLIQAPMEETKSFANRNTQQSLDHWQASLELNFSKRNDKTVLSKRQHQGPLRVQRPFYPEGTLCHVYLLHPPGGVVAGDQLKIDVQASEDTACLLTTPGASKYYRSIGEVANQWVNLKLAEQATLEWLPQESIIYKGARLVSSVNMDLAPNSKFIGWEILVFGRPASNESFDEGSALLNWHISRNNKPIFIEKLYMDHQALYANWGLNCKPVLGSMFVVGAQTRHLDMIREFIDDKPHRGVTLIEDILICRAMDAKVSLVRTFFENIRNLIRYEIIGYHPYAPRIWAT